MKFTLDNQIRTYLRSKRVVNPLNVTFTQKQYVNSQRIDDPSSEQNFRHFRNVLNQKVFGNGFKRFNRQLQMLVIREVSSDTRHHLHCVIEQPQKYEFEEFVFLINSVWSVTKFGYEQIHIEKPSSQQREDGWLDYIMKDYTKVSLSKSIDYVNSSVLSN